MNRDCRSAATVFLGPTLEPEVVGGYELLRRIGMGGMSEVLLARPADPARREERYALKRLLPELAARPGFGDLMRREIAVGSRVSHPNVVSVLDWGSEEGRWYLVTEYVEGIDAWKLTRRLSRRGERLPLDAVVLAAESTLAGLDHLHRLCDARGRPLGIVHRDVSPSNVFVSVRGEAKLGDLGIAQLDGAAAERERMRRLRGKIRFLSPEQIRGGPVDARSDVFAAGVLLAELALGRSPFAGRTDLDVLLAIRDVRINLIGELQDRLPEPLMRVLLRSLARDPDERYSTAAAMREDLRALAREQGLPFDPGALAAAVEHVLQPGDLGDEPVDRIPLTPLVLDPVGPREPPPTSERTPAIPIDACVVDSSGRTRIGPLGIAELVERVLAGEVGERDRVSVGGAPPLPVRDLPALARHLPPRDGRPPTDPPGAPDLSGLFRDAPAGRLFLDLMRRRETGLVRAENGTVRKDVYVIDGRPTHASSNVPGELLGETLVARGILSRIELDTALTLMPRYGGRLGDTLVALDLVDPLALFEAITEQVRKRILDLFTWRFGRWTFHRGLRCEKAFFPLPSFGPSVVHDGILASCEPRELESWFDELAETPIHRHETPDPPPESWVFGPIERAALDAACGGCGRETFERMRRSVPDAPPEELLAALRFTLTAGLLRADPTHGPLPGSAPADGRVP